MILLWKGASGSVAPFKAHGGNALVFLRPLLYI